MLSVQHRLILTRAAAEVAGSPSALESEFDQVLPVLMYHRIGHGTGGLHPSLTITPITFASQVRWLSRRGFAAIRPQHWLQWRNEGVPLPSKPVLLTFDDAYADTARHALPVLRDHGFAGLIFVPTGLIGERNTWDPGVEPRAGAIMTADEIKSWKTHGIEFGAHGRAHRDLTLLSGADLDAEVAGSRADLEGIVQDDVPWFAYPFGRHDEASQSAVEQSYELAFTADQGLNRLRTPSGRMRRTAVSPKDTLIDVEGRARVGRLPLERLRGTLRARSRAVAAYERWPRRSSPSR